MQYKELHTQPGKLCVKLLYNKSKQNICFKCAYLGVAMNMPKKVDIRKMHKKITDYHRNLIINTKIVK